MQATIVEHSGKTYQVLRDTYFNAKTPEKVMRTLASLISSKTPCRVFLGDIETGKAWNEEYDVCGTIGRSMGPVKIPLMINNARSMGGGALLDHCIVGILAKGNVWLYKHESFDVGAWRARAIDSRLSESDAELAAQGYHTEVLHNESVHARFKGPNSLAKADRYIDFMTGKRLRK